MENQPLVYELCDTMRDVSVVMAAFNEEKSIAQELDKLGKANVGEIIVVDDGSSDNTVQIVERVARKNKSIKLIKHKVNKGKGTSMKTGAKAAKNNKIVFVDADGQFNVSEIPRLVKEIENANMVVGVRNFENIPFKRRITNTLARYALFLGTGQKVEDAISGFRAINKKDFLNLKLKKNRYEIESEMSYRALRKKMKVKYVPVTVRYGSTSKITAKQGLLISLFLIKVALRVA